MNMITQISRYYTKDKTVICHLPKSFLPFEHGFLSDHIRHYITHQTPGEEVVSKIGHIILGGERERGCKGDRERMKKKRREEGKEKCCKEGSREECKVESILISE